MDAAEEARLIGLARMGDMRAYSRLVDAHQAPVRAFLRRLAGNHADADDLAQDAFARTWEVLARFDGRSSLRSFICGVGYQFWRRARRADGRRRARDSAYAELSETAHNPSPHAGAQLALRRAMEALPEDQAAALAHCLGQDFTHAEAADALGLPLGTVKSHINRGRARLQAALGVEPVESADHG
ncbi:MAG: RNA polymerase sigma factor [Hyphomonadaceae bacterium]